MKKIDTDKLNETMSFLVYFAIPCNHFEQKKTDDSETVDVRGKTCLSAIMRNRGNRSTANTFLLREASDDEANWPLQLPSLTSKIRYNSFEMVGNKKKRIGSSSEHYWSPFDRDCDFRSV